MNLTDGNPGVRPIVEHFGGLPEQPKRQIAEYIASFGLPIPEIYPDLSAAIEGQQPFIARSEGPYELFYSGLAESFRSSSFQDAKELDGLKALDAIMSTPERTFRDLTRPNVMGRSGFINVDRWQGEAAGNCFEGESIPDLAKTHSLSYWKEEQGANLFILEDS